MSDFGYPREESTEQTSTDSNNFTSETSWTDIYDAYTGFSRPGKSFAEQVMSYILMTIGTIGILGNGFVIVVLVRYRSGMLKRITNIYLLNQSVIDLLGSVFLFFHELLNEKVRNLHLSGIGGEILCRFWINSFSHWCMSTVSIVNLLAVTFERFFAITRPWQHKKSFSRSRVMISLPLIWLYGFLSDFIFTVLTSAVVEGQCYGYRFWISEEARRFSGVFFFAQSFVVPICCFCFCYYKMARRVLQRPATIRVAPVGANPPETNTHSERRTKIYQNVLKTLLIVVVAYFTCWCVTPIVYLLLNFNVLSFYETNSYQLYAFSTIMSFTNFIVNPFIYAAKYRQFQNSVRKLLGLETPSRTVSSDPTKSTKVVFIPGNITSEV